MATKESSAALEKIEEQLTCSVCLGEYTNPKILPCFHSFCQQCLEGVPRNQDSALPCPTCRKPCELPKGGVAGLQTSFVMNNLTEVSSLLKKNSLTGSHEGERSPAHNGVASPIMQPIADAKPEETVATCADHKKPMEIFCETCEILICHNCTVKKHRDHEYDVISDIFGKHRRAIEDSIRPVDQKINIMSNTLADLFSRKEKIVQQGKMTKENICQRVCHIKEVFDQAESQLSVDVNSIVQHKLCVLDKQIEEVETTLTLLKECRGHVDQTLSLDSPNQILSVKSVLMSDLKRAVQSSRDKNHPPIEQADIKLEKCPDLSEMHKKIGTISCTYHPAKVDLAPNDTAPLLGKVSNVDIVFSRFDNLPVSISPSLVSCTLIPPGDSKPMKCSVKESQQFASQYNIVFTSNTRGIHQLHVRVQDAIIPGSPLNVIVSVPPETLCNPVKTITGLKEPGGLAMTDDGLVIASEFHGHRVTILDKSGNKILTFGSHGKEKGMFHGPQGVAVSSRGTILVADHYNCRIQEFKMDGTFVTCVGSKGNGHREFNEPLGIAFHKKTGKLYIADRRNSRIQVLNSDLTFSHMFGCHGSEKGRFDYVQDVKFDNEGFVYVADFNNHRVQKFTLEGTFVLSFGSKGHLKHGQITHPDGLAVWRDLVFVSEGRGTKRVTVFTTMGKYVHRFGKFCVRRSMFDEHGYYYVSTNEGYSVF